MNGVQERTLDEITDRIFALRYDTHFAVPEGLRKAYSRSRRRLVDHLRTTIDDAIEEELL